MKHTIRILIFGVTGLLAISAFRSIAPELEIGSNAPKTDLTMMDVSGKDRTLDDLKGKNGLLVIFSCNTCPFVLAWENRYLTVSDKCKALGIGMVAVNSNEAYREQQDSFEEMKTHATKAEYDFPYVVDVKSELADAFGANRTPHVFLFNKDLKLVYRGAIDDNRDDATAVKKHWLLNALDELVAGKGISVATTKSIGCTIKRLK